MKKKDYISPNQALAIWKKFSEEGKTELPVNQRYVYRYIERYEGLLAFKTSSNHWNIDRSLWEECLVIGFPDLETRYPIMTVTAGLRYLHNNGIPQNYKLRQLRKDLAEEKWIIKATEKGFYDRVTRTHLNYLIRNWNGN